MSDMDGLLYFSVIFFYWFLISKAKVVAKNFHTTSTCNDNCLASVHINSALGYSTHIRLHIAVDISCPHCWFCFGFQSVLPHYVATKMSRIKNPNVFAPGPTTYVRQALGTVGVESRTMGYWSHALQVRV